MSGQEQLVPLPSQPEGQHWPTLTWATGPIDGDGDRLDELLDRAFRRNPNPELQLSLACVVIQRGRVVGERYGPATTSLTPLISWSMGKSMLHAAMGIAVGDGLLDIDSPAPIPEWNGEGDPRGAITIRHLLAMRDGLDFSEDYVDAGASHCLEMLFGQGAEDVAGYAASRPAAVPPGERFNYSSGTTNILSRILTDALVGADAGPEERRAATGSFLEERLFQPIGVTAAPRFDAAGNWVASSYVYAAARDFARFGLLYLRDGTWDGQRILPEGWVDHARTWVSDDPEEHGLGYGAQWWLYDDGLGTFAAKGYEGQTIMCVPALDVMIVRLGKTPVEHRPKLEAWYREIIRCFEE